MDLKKEFINESREHLATAEDDILALERPEDAGNETINRLFRSLHTIKGGAACIELAGIKELAHAMENVVGLVRDGSLAPGAEVTQLLLDGLDKLKTAVFSGNDFPAAGDQVIARCGALKHTPAQKTGGKTVGETKNAPARVFDVSRFDTSAARAQMLHLYEITLDLQAEFARTECAPSKVLEKLLSIGSLIASTHDLQGLRDKPRSELRCSFLLATMIDDPGILFPGLDIEPIFYFRYLNAEIPDFCQNRDSNTEKAHETPVYADPNANTLTAMAPLQTPRPKLAPSGTGPAAETAEMKHGEDQIVRVPVEIVDKLMNLAGELVVVRNRNAQVLACGNAQELSIVNQRLDAVTSEIQATVMRTRMCPVGGVFGRFTRVVRDLGKRLGKEIELEVTGADVELDKSIIDGLFEPLTHLVRNAADHGIESPNKRVAAGKPAVGRLRLSALHQTGQVNIQISDDGKGVDPASMRLAAIEKKLLGAEQAAALSDREAINLIFLPGFSTAEKVTDVSGRGVGMDAVKSSLQKLGGTVEIQSVAGKGTVVTIRLPLTLAIISALISTMEGLYFAIPQVNVVEVVWLHGDEVYQSVRTVDGKEVYWLRGKMLPLLRLSKILRIPRTFVDPTTGVRMPDRRTEAPDRRSEEDTVHIDKRKGPRDRRTSAGNSLYIVIIRVGSERFGLCVESIIDTEEIVVKPLHERLKTCKVYAGVTVLGDGVTAMILDIPELAAMGGIRYDTTEATTAKYRRSADELQKMLLFSIGSNGRFALPLSLLMRIDEVNIAEIQTGGGREYVRFRDSVIPLIRIERSIKGFSASYGPRYLYAIIPRIGKPIGIAAAEIIDVVDIDDKMERAPAGKKAIIGTHLLEGRVTSLLDLCALIDLAEPGWLSADKQDKTTLRKVVVAEDSSLYRTLIGSYLSGLGFEVLAAVDGKEAMNIIQREKGEIDGVLSDLEMPVVDGFEFARKMKSNELLRQIPLLGMSAMEATVARSRAMDAGFDDFTPKSDLPTVAEAFSALVMKAKRR
jgi:two-component system chemotaxis sensor kinase CheA